MPVEPIVWQIRNVLVSQWAMGLVYITMSPSLATSKPTVLLHTPFTTGAVLLAHQAPVAQRDHSVLLYRPAP